MSCLAARRDLLNFISFMFTRHLFLAAAGLAAAASLTGCNAVSDAWESTGNAISGAWESAGNYVPYFLKPHRDDVHQGNLVTSEMVLQLEQGMTDAQVQFLLGIPLVRDQFHQNRWDYVYFLLRGDGEQQLRRLTVYFNDERRVDHWTSDPMPDEQQADQLILGKIKAFEPRPPKTDLQNQNREAPATDEGAADEGRAEEAARAD